MFGSSNEHIDNPQVKFVSIQGDRIAPSHFEIYYETSNNTLLLHNLNELTEESCGLYKRLFVGEKFYLRPEDAFRIGKQEFLLERFNTGIIADIGQRKSMEDTYCCI